MCSMPRCPVPSRNYSASNLCQISTRAPSVGIIFSSSSSHVFAATKVSALCPSRKQYRSNWDLQQIQSHLVATLKRLLDIGVFEISAGRHPTLGSASRLHCMINGLETTANLHGAYRRKSRYVSRLSSPATKPLRASGSPFLDRSRVKNIEMEDASFGFAIAGWTKHLVSRGWPSPNAG